MQGSAHTVLPTWIEKKKACLNIRNVNEECFRYAVHAHYHAEEFETQEERVCANNYELFTDEVNIFDLDVLVKLCISGKCVGFEFYTVISVQRKAYNKDIVKLQS